MCSNPCESELSCLRPESNRGPYVRAEAAEERAQSERRQGGKLGRTAAAFASQVMHDGSSNLSLQCCGWF